MTSELSRTTDELITEYIFSAPLSETWVLVEGESDLAFLWEYMTDRNCILIDMQGKREIIDALSSQIMRGQRGIAGIIDADYGLLLQPQELNMDSLLFDEDCPDLEVILLTSRALKKSLRHDIRRIPKITVPVTRIESVADQLAEEAFRLGMEFGYFRLLNESERYGISFNCFWRAHQLEEFVDPILRTFDGDWFARRLADHHKTRWMNRSDRWIPYDELLKGVDGLKEHFPMPNNKLCRGKDVMDVAKLIGPNLLDAEFAKEMSRDQVSQITFDRLDTDLRKSYEFIYFAETSLYRNIRRWECESGDFRIIREKA